MVCLGDCYEIVEKKARIKSLDTCMECGACWYACPEDAIDFSWPPGGTGFRTEWG
ncbi:MAG: 4Fe-4S binding protein [Deltaproteobacteria bacterium]|nr:4Fe-4S binding protein [Deltaproteobacteria bacterium]MBN2844455.1 4Fe-4S binding protein [Deltaproteobacteria bacterium]